MFRVVIPLEMHECAATAHAFYLLVSMRAESFNVLCCGCAAPQIDINPMAVAVGAPGGC